MTDTTGRGGKGEAIAVEKEPLDKITIRGLLSEAGVDKFDDNVICQLLDFAYKYTSEVLEEAQVNSLHASKKTIELEDVQLAVQTKVDSSLAGPPHRELLAEFAEARNSQPLPNIRTYTGLRLPPDKHNLTAPNYLHKQRVKQEYRLQTAQRTPGLSLVSGGTASSGSGGPTVFRVSAPSEMRPPPSGGIMARPRPAGGTIVGTTGGQQPIIRLQQGGPPNLQIAGIKRLFDES